MANQFRNGIVYGGQPNDLVNLSKDSAKSFSTLYQAILSVPKSKRVPGIVITYLDQNGVFSSYQFNDKTLDTFFETNKWAQFGGYNDYINVSAEYPKPVDEYYNLQQAISTIPSYRRVIGAELTYETAPGKWSVYKFVGLDTSSNQFLSIFNWVRLHSVEKNYKISEGTPGATPFSAIRISEMHPGDVGTVTIAQGQPGDNPGYRGY